MWLTIGGNSNLCSRNRMQHKDSRLIPVQLLPNSKVRYIIVDTDVSHTFKYVYGFIKDQDGSW